VNALANKWFILALLVTPLIAAQPSPAQKEWALATTGILTESSGRRHDLLGEMEPSAAEQKLSQSQLDYWWGIHSHNELITRINDLRFHEPNAWDLVRSITLCRWGYLAGFITEDEAWDEIMPAARILQHLFSSWRELGRSYLSRRDLWSRDLNVDSDAARADLRALFRELLFLTTSPWRKTTWNRIERDLSTARDVYNPSADYAYRKLLFQKRSPWRRIPWNLDLGGGSELPVSTSNATIGFLTLISRPAGLTCFSLNLMDRAPQTSLLPDLEKIVGCRARLIQEQQYDGDWYVAGDCIRPDLAQGAEVHVEFAPETLAARLRREGVAELFYSISHSPAGPSSLSIPAKFHWMIEGMEYDVGSWDLISELPPLKLKYGFGLAEASRFYIPGFLFSLGIFVLTWWKKKAYAVVHWVGWTLLVTCTNAIAVVRLTLGQEGLSGDFVAVGVLLLLPLLVEVAGGPFVRPNFDSPRAWRVAFWSNLMLVPFAGLALTIADLQGGLNPATIFVAVALSFMMAAVSLRNQYSALGVAGGEVSEGDLRDHIFVLAQKARVRLRRFCVIPAGCASPGVFASPDGSLLLSEELIKGLSKREVEALAFRALVAQGSGETRKRFFAAAILAETVFLGSSWFVYWLGRVGTLLVIFVGLSLAGWMLLSLWRFWEYKGDRVAAALIKDPEALISALVHSERMLSGLHESVTIRADRIAKCHGIDEKRLREIVEAEQVVERYSLPMLGAPCIYSPM
jgi:Zn-dependent protease with chaperone function